MKLLVRGKKKLLYLFCEKISGQKFLCAGIFFVIAKVKNLKFEKLDLFAKEAALQIQTNSRITSFAP